MKHDEEKHNRNLVRPTTNLNSGAGQGSPIGLHTTAATPASRDQVRRLVQEPNDRKCLYKMLVNAFRTCLYNEFLARQFPKGSGSAPRSSVLLKHSISNPRLFFRTTLQSRRTSLLIIPLAVAKPTLNASQQYREVRSLFTGEQGRVMAQAAPSTQADTENINRFRQLFAGAMPKEEVGALSFLAVCILSCWGCSRFGALKACPKPT